MTHSSLTPLFSVSSSLSDSSWSYSSTDVDGPPIAISGENVALYYRYHKSVNNAFIASTHCRGADSHRQSVVVKSLCLLFMRVTRLGVSVGSQECESDDNEAGLLAWTAGGRHLSSNAAALPCFRAGHCLDLTQIQPCVSA